MNTVADLLRRNQGNLLTPELVNGMLSAYDEMMSETLWSSVPMRVVDLPTRGDPRVLVDDKTRVGNWVAERVGQAGEWGTYAALGLLNAEGELVAGVVFNDFTETNAYIHVAFANRYALKRVFIHAVFDYAFNQLGLTRLTGMVEETNTDALIFDQHIGFEVEHIVRNGCADGDVYMLVLWRDKCRWIKRGDD